MKNVGYSETNLLDKDSGSYDELMSLHTPLVKRIAYHLMGRLPATVQRDDLVQAGMIGLFEALKAYDKTRGASFETYARIRIQGAMIDEVRRSDWTPRSVYRKSRQLSEAVRKIEEREGRDAGASEVAEALDMDLEEYNTLVIEAAGCQILSYEDMTALNGGHSEQNNTLPEPYQELEESDFKRGLSEKIAGLPERERLVMSLYYNEEVNMREIGEVLGITEGRVCQIHGQALIRLRGRMSDWSNENTD